MMTDYPTRVARDLRTLLDDPGAPRRDPAYVVTARGHLLAVVQAADAEAARDRVYGALPDALLAVIQRGDLVCTLDWRAMPGRRG